MEQALISDIDCRTIVAVKVKVNGEGDEPHHVVALKIQQPHLTEDPVGKMREELKEVDIALSAANLKALIYMLMDARNVIASHELGRIETHVWGVIGGSGKILHCGSASHEPVHLEGLSHKVVAVGEYEAQDLGEAFASCRRSLAELAKEFERTPIYATPLFEPLENAGEALREQEKRISQQGWKNKPKFKR